jgi:predicted phosphatase
MQNELKSGLALAARIPRIDLNRIFSNPHPMRLRMLRNLIDGIKVEPCLQI